MLASGQFRAAVVVLAGNQPGLLIDLRLEGIVMIAVELLVLGLSLVLGITVLLKPGDHILLQLVPFRHYPEDLLGVAIELGPVAIMLRFVF